MENYKDIDTVVFDLGGVVIDLDRDRAVSRLEELGLASVGTFS